MTAAFQAQMRRLVGLKFQPASLDTHWEALKDMPDALLAAAVGVAQREADEFPSPSELMLFAARIRDRVFPLGEEPDRSTELAEPVTATLPTGKVIPFTRHWKYYCEQCHDTGWKSWWCGGGVSPVYPWVSSSPCQRMNEHDAHEWVSRCACAESNPAVRRKRESDAQMAAKRAERSK